jgi:dolichol-phosphate mannosyltransferase
LDIFISPELRQAGTKWPVHHLSPDLTVVVPCFNERDNVEVLVERLAEVLWGLEWEVVFVDDHSPDGTAACARRLARLDPRVRCISRIGRRGLASAVIEGALASSARYVAVMDGDLQHDETRLPAMYRALQQGADIVVGCRQESGVSAPGFSSRFRCRLSELGTRLVKARTPTRVSDPLSGFFMMDRELFETIAPRLTGQGFKILLDILLTAPVLRIVEIPFQFRERHAGESKLDLLTLLHFGALMLDKALGGLMPLRFVAFAGVGSLGVLVHLAVLNLVHLVSMAAFQTGQIVATAAAMIFNFHLNNQLTYRDRKLRGLAALRAASMFVVICSAGAIANLGIANLVFSHLSSWTLAGLSGALVGGVWNYAISSTLIWHRR